MSSGEFDRNRLILVDNMVREYGCPCLFQIVPNEDDEGDADYPQFTTGAIGKIEKMTSLQTAKIRILPDDQNVRIKPIVRDGRSSRKTVERSAFEGREINIPVGCPVRVTRSDNKRKEYNSISQIKQDMPPYIRVEEEVMGITTQDDGVNMFLVPKSTVLQLHTNQPENKSLLCLMNETKAITFHCNCSGRFTGLDDKAEYKLEDLVEKVQLPVKVDMHIINQDDVACENETWTENLRTMLSGPVEILSATHTQLYVGCTWIGDGTYQPFVLPIKSGMRCYPLASAQSKEVLVSRYFSSKIDFETVERKVYNIYLDPPSIVFLRKLVVAWRKVPRFRNTGSIDVKDLVQSRKEETDDDYENVSPVLPERRALHHTLSSDLIVHCKDFMSDQAPPLPPRRNVSQGCRPLTSYTPSRDCYRDEVATDREKGRAEQPTKALVQNDSTEKNSNSQLSNHREMVERKAQYGFKKEHDELKKHVTNELKKRWNKSEADASVTGKKTQNRQSIHTDDIYTGDKMSANHAPSPATKTKTLYGDYDRVAVQSEPNSGKKAISKVALNPFRNKAAGTMPEHKTVCNTEIPKNSPGLNTCIGDQQNTKILTSNTEPMEDEDYLVPIPLAEMLTKQARKNFYSFSVMQTAHCFRFCRLDTLANICETEKLDGSFFQIATEENMSQLLSKEPFNLNSLQIFKVKKIIDGWRPKMDEFGGVFSTTSE